MSVDDTRTGTWVTATAEGPQTLQIRRCRLVVVTGTDSGKTAESVDGVIRVGARLGNHLQLADPKVSGWLAAPHPMREVGAMFSSEKNITTPEILPKRFDAILFVATLGLPLISGRELTSEDRQGTPRVALINTATANNLFPGQNPCNNPLFTHRVVRSCEGSE